MEARNRANGLSIAPPVQAVWDAKLGRPYVGGIDRACALIGAHA